MSKQDKANPLTIALGTALASTLGAVGIANASATDGDVFAMEELTNGQLMAGAHEEGGCGEGKCAGDKDGDKEGGCGGDGEGSCGGDKEGACGGDGEGSCGGDA